MVDLLNLPGLVKNELNLDLSCFNSAFLEKILEERKVALNCDSLKDYVSLINNNKEELTCLSQSLYISYTQFFRSPLIFSMLEQVVLPKLIAQKEKSASPRIRIWSAGCSTGQEPYSIAFILSELNKRKSEINWSIFATDISQKSIDLATKGEYGYNELENLRLIFFDSYFSKNGTTYAVNRSIRNHIHFSYYDLLDADSISPSQSIFGDFDLIVCCNVLIYYNADIQAKLLEKFYKTMADNGCLVLGEDERLTQNSRFSPAFSYYPVYYRL